MKRRNRLLIGLLVLCIGIFCSALTMTVRALIPYLQAGQEYEKLDQICVKKVETPSAERNIKETTSDFCPIAVDFQMLKKINPDIVGWIYGEGTGISYPVVQGSNNEFYLSHMPDQTYNQSGSIFMDCRNTDRSGSSNEILYGHHMKNGSMFAGLKKYASQDYYEAHNSFYYLTEHQNYRLEILRAGVTTDASDVYQIAFQSAQEKEDCTDRWNKKSCITSMFQEKTDAALMTLSTCSYETLDARFVVQGQLIGMN